MTDKIWKPNKAYLTVRVIQDTIAQLSSCGKSMKICCICVKFIVYLANAKNITLISISGNVILPSVYYCTFLPTLHSNTQYISAKWLKYGQNQDMIFSHAISNINKIMDSKIPKANMHHTASFTCVMDISNKE